MCTAICRNAPIRLSLMAQAIALFGMSFVEGGIKCINYAVRNRPLFKAFSCAITKCTRTMIRMLLPNTTTQRAIHVTLH